jgi:alkaline phosphatase D
MDPKKTAPLLGRRAMVLAAAAAFVPHARAADVPRFELGVASGCPSEHGVVLWTRLTGEGLPAQVPVCWEVAHDRGFARIAQRGEELAEAAWAHSVHAEPAGLEPAREYWYRFTALGQASAVGRTRTAPPSGAEVATLRLMIASCQHYEQGHYAAWRDADPGLDLIVFLGDYIYEHGSSPLALRRHRGARVENLAAYRDRYAQYKSDALLQAAHAAAPWLMVWDDHEVENDYAGAQGERLQSHFLDQRAAAYRAYWEHLPFPKSARPRGPDMRIYARLDWGTLARFHLLDGRQYRDPQACPEPGYGGSRTLRLNDCRALLDPKRTLLGGPQERWLEEGWSTEHRWNLLAQQTLMARFNTEDPAVGGGRYWNDGWDGYPAARQRLLSVVEHRRIPGVVVLGGDVHTHYAADLRADFDDPMSPVVASEFCTTSISSRSWSQQRVDSLLPLNPHVHYGRSDRRGSIRFEVDSRELRAELRAVDDARDAASAVRTAARFVVDRDRPGPQRA